MPDFNRMSVRSTSAQCTAIGAPPGLCAREPLSRKRTGSTLFQRTAGHAGELAHETVGDLAVNRQPALAFELLDCGSRVGIENAGRLDLAEAKIGKCPLHGRDAL